jgi:uncharacterized membrane protein
MSSWRYNRNGRPSDPVDQPTLEGLLKEGTLPPDTLVWREGMPEWAKAHTVPELAAATTPPSTATTALVSVPPAAEMPPHSQKTTSQQGPSPSPEPAQQGGGSPPPLVGLPSASAGISTENADIEQNRVFAVLAYIGILFLVPLLAAPKSRFARYHTNQGIVLFIANIVASVATIILIFVPFVGCVSGILAFALPVASLVFMILGIVNAASGLYKPLPLIGHYELMKSDPGSF